MISLRIRILMWIGMPKTVLDVRLLKSGVADPAHLSRILVFLASRVPNPTKTNQRRGIIFPLFLES
jgi:hypothetical protein